MVVCVLCTLYSILVLCTLYLYCVLLTQLLSSNYPLLIISRLTVYGLFKYNTEDVGIGEGIQRIWHGPAPAPTPTKPEQ